MNLLQKLRKKIKEGMLEELLREARWLLCYIRRYRLTVLIHILLGVSSIVMSLCSSVASKYLIDAVTGYKSERILLAAGAMGGLLLLSIVLRCVSSRVGARINLRVQNEIQAEVYQKILRTDWESLEGYRSGDLMNRLTSDVSAVAGGVTSFVPGLISSLVQFFGALAVMLIYDPTMAMIALVGIPISVLMSRLLVRRMRNHNKKMKGIASDMMAFYEDSLSNITSVKSFGITGLFQEKMLRLQARYREEYLEYNLFSVRTAAVMSLLGSAVSAGCFGWGVYRLWSGKITYGSLTMFLQLASALSSAFSSLIGLVSTAISVSTSAGRVMTLCELPEENCPDGPDFSRAQEVSLELHNAGFAYQSGEAVLENADFIARPGELIAITGPSGEGKTTMLRMLLGLIRPHEGTAELISEGVRYPLSAATRSAFAYVPQGNSMFAGTIRENLTLTRNAAGEAAMLQALQTACAYDFVMALPGKLDYEIGGRGKGLSEGQAQRLAIARALLCGAPVLLLDEATSALDEATEAKLLQNLMDSGAVRTCIFVTHRPGAVRVCTRRYRVEKGKVREEH